MALRARCFSGRAALSGTARPIGAASRSERAPGGLRPLKGEDAPLPPASVRLDVWLDVACVFPTRSQAKAAIEGGKVEINGARAKPHREIRPGDRLTITTSKGDPRRLVVRGLADRSIPKARARELYEDVTPPPPPEVAEARRLDRLLAPRSDAGRPDRREQRERRDRKRYRGE